VSDPGSLLLLDAELDPAALELLNVELDPTELELLDTELDPIELLKLEDTIVIDEVVLVTGKDDVVTTFPA